VRIVNDRTEALALKFVQTWRNGPAQNIWAEAIHDLGNPAQAEAAYLRLRDEADRPPTIHDLRVTYRTLSTRPDTPSDPNGCHYCDGHGWISITETHHGIEYSASAACTHCTAGKTAARTVAWANQRTEQP
jgi:hypothetical protein